MAVWQKYEKKRNFILVGCKNILIFAKSYAVSPAPSTACGERLFGIFTSQRLGIAPILFFTSVQNPSFLYLPFHRICLPLPLPQPSSRILYRQHPRALPSMVISVRLLRPPVLCG